MIDGMNKITFIDLIHNLTRLKLNRDIDHILFDFFVVVENINKHHKKQHQITTKKENRNYLL